MLRPCLGTPGDPCGLPSSRTRCPEHQSAIEAMRPSRRVRGHYDTRWLTLRDVAIRRHPWCEDCRTPGDEANPLTGDHRLPLSRGGRNVIGNVAVLCRRCNSAKGARVERVEEISRRG